MLANLLSWLRLRRFAVRPFPKPAPKRPRRKPILESERFEDRNTAGETWNLVLGTALFGTGVAWLQDRLLGGAAGAAPSPAGSWDRPAWGTADTSAQPLFWVQPAADSPAEETRPGSPPPATVGEGPAAVSADGLRPLPSGPLDDPFAGLFGNAASDTGARGAADLSSAEAPAPSGGGGGSLAPEGVPPQPSGAAPLTDFGTAASPSATDLLQSAGLLTPSPVGAASPHGVLSGSGSPTALAPGNPSPPVILPGPPVPLPILPAQGPPAQPSLIEAFAKVPLAFEANRGQTDAQVRFLARGKGYTVFLTDTETVLSLAPPADAQGAERDTRDVVRLHFDGANPAAQLVGTEALPSRSNYFVGNDPSKWLTDVPHFAEVTYRDLYPGIDLVFHGTDQQRAQFDFHVKPGADPNQIRLRYDGASAVDMAPSGDLRIETAHGELVQQTPTLFQDSVAQRQPVGGRYRMAGDGTVGFHVEAFDATRELVIDPVVNYATYLGGASTDTGRAIAVDLLGQAYVTGSSSSSAFPTTAGSVQTTSGGSQDAFIAKFNATGSTLIYSTYLGGSGSDTGNAVAVDAAGNVYVTGATGSSNFPATSGAYDTTLAGNEDAFVVKLNATGSYLTYASYLGGSGDENAEAGNALAVDSAGQVTVSGATQSGSFPTTLGAAQTSGDGFTYDAFVTRLNAAGTALVYSTYLGGSSDDVANGLAVDSSGNAFVAGYTRSSNFPTASAYQGSRSGTQDAFLTEVNNAGSAWTFSTYLGGTSSETGTAVALTSDGKPTVVGATSSSNFPTTGGAYDTSSNGSDDAFITQFAAGGGSLAFSTYLGGSGSDTATAVAVDSDGIAHIAGATASTNFPTVSPTQSSNGGGTDAFLTRLSAAGSSLTFSTYLGGSGTDQANGVAVDTEAASYVIGSTSSSNLPTVGPFQGSTGGGQDAFIAKVSPPPGSPTFTSISSDTGSSGSDQITTDLTLTLSGTADPNSTITVYRLGVGQLGTTSADSGGAWSYDYTGTTLAEGTYGFYATATLSGKTSPPSRFFLVSVDRTAPTLTLDAPSTTKDYTPEVKVVASDLLDLADGTTVTFDVDTNNDNDFADAGETGFTTATLTNGVARKEISVNAVKTVRVWARVTDKAGNEATSSASSVQVQSVTNDWAMTGECRSADPLLGDALLQTGNLHRELPLDLDQSPGSGFALAYNSSRVDVKPIVQTTVQAAQSYFGAPTLTLTLTWNGSAQTPASVNPGAKGELWTAGVRSSSAVSSSGRYPWAVDVAVEFTGDDPIVNTVSGTAYVVTEATSPYGGGWTFANVDRLVSISSDANGPAGLLRVYGRQGHSFYQDAGGGAYTSPAGDPGTLVKNGDNSYTYTPPDGTKWDFNSSGLQTKLTSPDGKAVTTFTYTDGDSDGQTDDIATVASPDGALATFTYASNVLSKIDVGSRTYTFTQASGTLTKVTNPDGGLHSLTYDGIKHLTQDKLAGVQTDYSYSSGVLSGITPSGGGATSITPAAAQGIGTVLAGAAYAKVTDAVSRETRTVMDLSGRPTQQTLPNGGVVQWTRDSNGWVTTSTDALGRATTFVLDSKGYVTQRTDPDGSLATFTYQTDFHALTNQKDELGHSYTYTYDASGHRTTEVNPLNQTTTLTYASASGLLETVKDALGRVGSFTYDSSRRLSTTVDALAGVATVTYDTNGNIEKQIDVLGRTTTLVHDAMGRLIRQIQPVAGTSTFTYDTAGLLTEQKDPLGRTQQKQYDGRGLPTQQQQTVGTPTQQSKLFGYDSAGQQTSARDGNGGWTYQTFDALGNVKTSTDAEGGVRRMVYDLAGQLTASRDADGRWTKYEYDSRGRVTKVTDPTGGVTTLVYDAVGNRTRIINPAGQETRTEYDTLNRPTTVIEAYGSSVQRTVTMAYDAVGNRTSVTDALGRETRTQFDSLNRPTTVIEAYGSSVERTTTVAYDAVGNKTGMTDPLGRRTGYTFDSLNRLTKTTDAVGTADERAVTVVYDAVNNVVNTIDGLNRTATFAYDGLNRRVSQTDALNRTATVVYDANGQVMGQIDPLGRMTRQGYDGIGRPVIAADALGNLTRQYFDPAGNVIAQKDALGRTVQTVYDDLDRPVRVTDALGNVTSLAYDGVGNVLRSYDALGNATTFTYDSLNRRVTTLDPGGGTATVVYDAVGNVVNTINALGNKTTFVYDALNRQTQTIDARGGVVTMLYDAVGNQTGLIDPVGNRTTFAYDSLNRVIQDTDPFNKSVTFAYDKADRLTSRTDRLGRRRDFTYDNGDRQTGETWVAAGGGTAQLLTFTYDNADNQLTAVNAAGSYTLTYDSLNRVTEARGPFSAILTFTYDAVGNRTKVQDSFGGVTTSTYDANNHLTRRDFGGSGQTPLRFDQTYTARNQVASVTRYSDLAGTTKVGESLYTFDGAARLTNLNHKNGSGTSLTNLTYTYDTHHRVLTEVRNGGTPTTYSYDTTDQVTNDSSVTYTYDLNGNRTMTGYQTGTGNRLTNDGTYTYTYDDEGNLTKKSKGANDETWTFTYDHRNLMTGVEKRATDGGTLQMKATYTYDAFGNRIEKSVDDDGAGAGAAVVTRFVLDNWKNPVDGMGRPYPLVGLENGDVLADLNGSNALQMRYLRTDEIDQLVARVNGSGTAAWYLKDRLGSARDVTDNSGVVQSHLEYDSFGKQLSETDPSWSGRMLWTGRESEGETGFYFERGRFDNVSTGRFTSLDPVGFAAGDANLYRYVRNNPTNVTDPSGLIGPAPGGPHLELEPELGSPPNPPAPRPQVPRPSPNPSNSGGIPGIDDLIGPGPLSAGSIRTVGGYTQTQGLGQVSHEVKKMVDHAQEIIKNEGSKIITGGGPVAKGGTITIAGRFALAGECALVDGPFPIGDIIGGVIIACTIVEISLLTANKEQISIIENKAKDILPGTLKREYPSEYLDNTLAEVKEMLKTATGKDKKKLQKAKKLLEQVERLMGD